MNFRCKENCKAECCGTVPVPKEFLKKHRNKTQKKYEKLELGEGFIHPVTRDGKCVFLNKELKCEIYKVRPYICKIYGTIKELQCPYVDLNGNIRDENEVIKVKNEIKNFVDEHFYWFQTKYKIGRILTTLKEQHD